MTGVVITGWRNRKPAKPGTGSVFATDRAFNGRNSGASQRLSNLRALNPKLRSLDSINTETVSEQDKTRALLRGTI